MPPAPARRRSAGDRRAQLVAIGLELLPTTPVQELTIDEVARRAGISRSLLFHYFPSKRDYFVATLERAAQELQAVTAPSGEGPPLEQLASSIDAFLGWIEEHSEAYGKLMQGATSVAEVHDLVEAVRRDTVERILAGIGRAEPAARTAVTGWLWFMDGVCLDWIAHRSLTRSQLRDLLLRTLGGALAAVEAAAAAGQPAPGDESRRGDSNP